MRKSLMLLIGTACLCVRAGNDINLDFESEREGRYPKTAVKGGSAEIVIENLSWNRCLRFVCTNETRTCRFEDLGTTCIRNATICLGGATWAGGFPVEPDTMYDFSVDLKDAGASRAFLRVFECQKDGKGVLRQRLPVDIRADAGENWKTFRGAFRTSRTAVLAQIVVELWAGQGGTLGNETGKFFELGSGVLIDNVKITRSANMDRLFNSGRHTAIAPVSPVVDMSVPFLPKELLNPPTNVVVRAAVNEKKPLPVAIGNLTDRAQTYRVVLETYPEGKTYYNTVPFNGTFGLKGFPEKKITLRYAAPYKKTDAPLPNRFLDPLVKMDEAQLITVPPREAGLVWIDFDTYDVVPGDYKGRLRVIPLCEGATYTYNSKLRRQDATATKETFLPVTLRVDPITLTKRATRPGYFCWGSDTPQTDELIDWAADLGAEVFLVGVGRFAARDATNRNSRAGTAIATHRARMAKYGVKPRFQLMYGALEYSQEAFNPKRKPELKWPAWKKMLVAVRDAMRAHNVSPDEYTLELLDEPWARRLPEILEALKIAKETAPEVPIVITFGGQDMTKHDFMPMIEPTVKYAVFHDSPTYFNDEFLAKMKGAQSRGMVIGHYKCQTSIPSPVEYYRHHCWRGEYYGMDVDYLYCFITRNNVGDGEMSFNTKPNGGMMYKTTRSFVPSIRYMVYREGMTDIKYLAALRAKRGNEPEVKAFLDKVVKGVLFDHASDDGYAEKMRERMRTLLLYGK